VVRHVPKKPLGFSPLSEGFSASFFRIHLKRLISYIAPFVWTSDVIVIITLAYYKRARTNVMAPVVEEPGSIPVLLLRKQFLLL
jgi:hypothetical protein